MTEPSAGRVGSAMTWKAVQLGSDRVISLVRFVVLARILAPGEFGLLAIATVSLDLLLTVTNFGMIPALVQRRDPQRRDYDAAWTVVLLRGAAIATLVVAAAPLIARLFGDPEATNVIRLLALRPLISGFTSIRVADLERHLDFRRLALIEVPGALVHTAVAIASAPVLGVYGLVAGMLAGAAVSVLLSYVHAPHRPRLLLDRRAAEPLFRYGRWILATGIAGVVGEAALRVAVSRLLGTAELGVYFLASRLAALPNGVVSLVVGAVAFPVHARLQTDDRRGAVAFRANVTALLASLVPVYAVLAALAPALVRDVLGARWDGTVPLIRLLAAAAVAGLIVDAVIPLLEGRGRPQQVTVLIVVRSVVVVGLAWPAATLFGVTGAALAVLLAELPTQLVAAAMARRSLRQPFAGLRRHVAVSALAAGASASVAWGIAGLVASPAGLFLAAALAGATAVAGMAILDRWLRTGLAGQLVRAFPVLGRIPGLRGAGTA